MKQWVAAIGLLCSSTVVDAADAIDSYVECMSGKTAINTLLRMCPYYEQKAIEHVIASWTQAGKLEQMQDALAAHGKSVSDLTIQPYGCAVPDDVLNDEAVQRRTQDQIETSLQYVLEELYLPTDLNWADLTEKQACAAFDTALVKKGQSAEFLKEYGIE